MNKNQSEKTIDRKWIGIGVASGITFGAAFGDAFGDVGWGLRSVLYSV